MPYNIGVANLSRTWCSTWQWSDLPVVGWLRAGPTECSSIANSSRTSPLLKNMATDSTSQLTLWPKSLCQSRTGVETKCRQDWANTIPICHQRFISIPNTYGDVFLTQLFPILYVSGYTFDDLGPFFMGSGLQCFRSSSESIYFASLYWRHTSILSSGPQIGDMLKILKCMAG